MSLTRYLILGVCLTAGLQTTHAGAGDGTDPLSHTASPDPYYGDATQSPVDTGFDNWVTAIGTYQGDLIVGGYFLHADNIFAIKIAGWNGAEWYAMPNIPNGNPVYDILEFDGNLYTGYALPRLNMWDGSTWTELQPYLHSSVSGNIRALAEFNSELYVAGTWNSDNGQPDYIAIWNGAGWDTVGTGMGGQVWALTNYNGGLVAGGYFTTADGSPADRIAFWNGSTWSAIGGGIADGGPRALTVYNGDLIAAGSFTDAGGVTVSNIARWDGSAWHPLGSGLDGAVEDLYVFNGDLIAGGWFSASGSTSMPYIARWDGSTWSAIGTEIDDRVIALGEYGGYLVAGGRFTSAGGGYVALWDNSIWRPVSDFVTDVADDNPGSWPSGFALEQNYPNPFNPSTTIDFTLARRAQTRVEILNVAGQVVKQLLDRTLAAGEHGVEWDGTDASGNRVATGMYFYRLVVDDQAQTRKMVLLK